MDRVKKLEVLIEGAFCDTVTNIVRNHTGNHEDSLLLLRVQWDADVLHEFPILTKRGLEDLELGILDNPFPDFEIFLPPENKKSIIHITYLFYQQRVS